ncbi:hypothetical protein FRIGORI9N_400142 [Frigoribacterium sp. 9N]|nr:hypothetical protein FRIGORI9N_400142 [Frigoribacterium sp. 9N]
MIGTRWFSLGANFEGRERTAFSLLLFAAAFAAVVLIAGTAWNGITGTHLFYFGPITDLINSLFGASEPELKIVEGS